jgi:hypothetical protein
LSFFFFGPREGSFASGTGKAKTISFSNDEISQGDKASGDFTGAASLFHMLTVNHEFWVNFREDVLRELGSTERHSDFTGNHILSETPFVYPVQNPPRLFSSVVMVEFTFSGVWVSFLQRFLLGSDVVGNNGLPLFLERVRLAFNTSKIFWYRFEGSDAIQNVDIGSGGDNPSICISRKALEGNANLPNMYKLLIKQNKKELVKAIEFV